MNSIRRSIAVASLTSLLGILAWSSPAWAIHPMGLRLMPFFRVTPALNGMRPGMPMNPRFNVQTGFVAVPTFHNERWWRNHWMANRYANSLYAAPGNYNMMATYGSYPSMSGYGGGYNQLTSVPQAMPAYENNNANGPLGANAAEASRMLTAAGLPNDQGHMTWPVGLQVLFPITENADLINQLEARFQTAAVQKTTGAVDEELLKGARQDIAKFRQKLHGRQPYMAIPTYQEADRFLKTMDTAVDSLQGNRLTTTKQY
jgi:hypothetical protein